MQLPRYNLALIPKQQSIYIQLAEQLHDGREVDYILSSSSLAHITMAQFRCSNDLLEQLWQQIKMPTPLSIKMVGFDSFQSESIFAWYQLIPEDVTPLNHLHAEICSLLLQHHINPLNRYMENYYPHLTLIHTSHLTPMKYFALREVELTDTFHLALGESDEHGQLLKLLKQ